MLEVLDDNLFDLARGGLDQRRLDEAVGVGQGRKVGPLGLLLLLLRQLLWPLLVVHGSLLGFLVGLVLVAVLALQAGGGDFAGLRLIHAGPVGDLTPVGGRLLSERRPETSRRRRFADAWPLLLQQSHHSHRRESIPSARVARIASAGLSAAVAASTRRDGAERDEKLETSAGRRQ